VIEPRLISRFDTEVKDRGFTKTTERCPHCNTVGQNFLGFRDPSGAEKLANVVMGCFKCGTLFISRRFLSGLDIKEMQILEVPRTGPEPEPTIEGESAASSPVRFNIVSSEVADLPGVGAVTPPALADGSPKRRGRPRL